MGHRLNVLLLTSTLLVACGGDTAPPGKSQSGEEGLPQPGAAAGSVTGMPNPGTRSVQPAPLPQRQAEAAPELEGSDGTPFDPDLPSAPPVDGTQGEIGIPPPDTMPTMPAPVPDPVETRLIPPPQS